jgi:AraC-like DNA-binding protein
MADPSLAAGRAADPDAVVRLAERDPATAARLLLDRLQPAVAAPADWPDRLAADLRALAPFEMGGWAASHGLRAETVSRGFRQAYGVSPKAYRAAVRARAAHAALRDRSRSLPAVAADLGFADQAHMTRAVRDLTGAPPRVWRALAA